LIQPCNPVGLEQHTINQGPAIPELASAPRSSSVQWRLSGRFLYGARGSGLLRVLAPHADLSSARLCPFRRRPGNPLWPSARRRRFPLPDDSGFWVPWACLFACFGIGERRCLPLRIDCTCNTLIILAALGCQLKGGSWGNESSSIG